VVGRPGDDLRDGPRREGARLRVPRDLRPHRQRRRRARARRRRRAPSGRGDRPGERAARALPRAPRHGVRHPTRRLARPPGRPAGRARLGAGERPRRPARLTRGADEACAHGARVAVRQLPQPSHRAPDQLPAAERDRPRGRPRAAGRAGPRGRGERAPDRLDLRDEHVRLAREAGVRSSARPTRTRSAASRTSSCRWRRPDAGAPGRRMCSTRGASTRCSRAASAAEGLPGRCTFSGCDGRSEARTQGAFVP
jgi:hypothetical protein